MNFNDNIPYDVRQVLRILNERGHEAYIVGGAIRNLILNKEPKDWDITTSATTDEIQEAFFKKILIGEKYGTIAVDPIGLGNYHEVTTFRCDGNYSDGRHPDQVTFTKSLEEDLKRRDFTINAMAMGLDGEIIDYYGGINDLENKIIKCVGKPEDRLDEDKLRALRAVRFASQYDLDIEYDLFYAINNTSLEQISKERIREELNKILLSETPSIGIENLIRLDLIDYIIPEIKICVGFDQSNIHHHKSVFDHIMKVLDNIDPILELRLAALFHDIGKPATFSLGEDGNGHFYEHHKESARICREVMERLKYSNKEIEYVSELVYWHMTRYEFMRSSSAKRFINKVGIDKLDGLFKLQVADIAGSKPPFDFTNVYKLKFECERIINEKQPMSVKDLKITGIDLMNELGLKQGKEIGVILNQLLEIVLEDETLNVYEYLLNTAQHEICKSL